MFFRRRFGRRRVYRKTQLRKRTGGRRKVSKSVKTYVKKAIHRNIENKEFIDYWQNMSLQTIGNGTNTGNNCRQLLPLPALGTSSAQRVGNNLKIVRGVLKGSVNLLPYDVAYNPLSTPVWVKIIIFRDLLTTGTQPIQNGSFTSYFDTFWKINNGSVPMQGAPFDMMASINDTKFRILAQKTFKLGAASATSTGAVGTAGYFDNSPMSVPFYFNWTKYAKKIIKYEEGGAYPTNDNIYIVCQPVRADGAASSSYKLAEWHGYNHIKFEDA